MTAIYEAFSQRRHGLDRVHRNPPHHGFSDSFCTFDDRPRNCRDKKLANAKTSGGETIKLAFFPYAALVCACLVVLALAIYGQTYGHGFSVFDDDDYVVQNRRVQAGLTGPSLYWALTTGAVANWHPLTWMSHMLDCHVFGLHPGAHHLVSVTFHAANGVLLFLILRSMTGMIGRSAVVAALFVVHPLHVESVAWISERKDVLSTFFWFLATASYLRWVRRPNLVRYLVVVVLFALGLMAKPMLVTFPCVLLLLDYWPLGRFPNTARTVNDRFRPVIEKLPLFALSVVSAYVTFAVQQHGGAMRSLGLVPPLARLANAAVSYVWYAAKAVWPADLSVYYPLARGAPLWEAMAAALLIAGVTAGVLSAARRRRYLAVGWFWYLGTLVPVIGLVQVGSQAVADRYMYVPIVGLFVMAVWGIPDLLQAVTHRRVFSAANKQSESKSDETTVEAMKLARPAALDRPMWLIKRASPGMAPGMAAGVVVAAFGLVAGMQTRYWLDDVSLFEHAIDVTSDNDLAHYSLGIALKRAGRTDDAAAHFTEAIRLRPTYVNAYIYMGLIRYEQRNFEEAARFYSHAIRYASGHPNHGDAENNLGGVYVAQGRVGEALTHYQRAAQLLPQDASVHYNLGGVLEFLKRYDEASAHYDEALRLNPALDAARNARKRLAATRSLAQPTAPLPKPDSAK